MKPRLINPNDAELNYSSGWKLTLNKNEPLSFMLFMEAIAKVTGGTRCNIVYKMTDDKENGKMVVELRCLRGTATEIRDYINYNLPDPG